MNQICGIHQTEMTWKTGVSNKTGKPYAFWACSQKMPDGAWCSFKAPKPQGQTAQFNQQLNVAASQIDQHKKDDLITRTAIAKSMIERGTKFSTEALIEANAWFSWCKSGSRPKEEPTQVILNDHFQPPTTPPSPTYEDPGYEEVEVSSIPF